MQKYLSYFGLEGYLYIYKSDSRELARYLGSHRDFLRRFIDLPNLSAAIHELIFSSDNQRSGLHGVADHNFDMVPFIAGQGMNSINM